LEMERAERENERMLKISMHLKEDSKVHLDRLFEDLYNHVKNFA
jgi:predicted small metal-binding protein